MTAVAQGADILAVGMVTPVGMDAPSAAAAIRAGLSRVRDSSVQNKASEAQGMALVPDDVLPPVAEALEARGGMTSAHARMLQLAAPALAQALDGLRGPPPVLFLAVPEQRPGEPDAVGASFVADLATQAEVPLDHRAVKLFRQGGAGSLFALHGALSLLGSGRAETALMGGVDSFLDLRRLAALDLEDRLLGEEVLDGFIPGEGAAVLLLARPGVARRLGVKPIARVTGIGIGAEKGHRYSAEPYKGDGLARVFQELFAALPRGILPIRCVYGGFNGENLPAKEWAVACMRSSERFAADLQIEHPADCIGDPGAAYGAIMVGLAALGLQKGYRRDPCLVWCTSDREPRAVAMLQAAHGG